MKKKKFGRKNFQKRRLQPQKCSQKGVYPRCMKYLYTLCRFIKYKPPRTLFL